MTRRAILAGFIFLFAVALPMKAAIGDSLEDLRRAYGHEFEVSTYRPDLYATSYDFQKGGAKISATILPDRASKIDVFFEKRPTDEVPVLLERYSGAKAWRSVSTSDPGFERYFPLFDPKRCSFFVADGVAALVQRDVGFGELVLWIQSDSYPDLLRDYRQKQKGGPSSESRQPR